MKENHSCIFQNIALSIIFLFALFVTGCGKHAYYKVAKGDTLYSIGWQYQVDYRTIASWNNIQPPYVIHEGDWVRVTPAVKSSRTITASLPNTTAVPAVSSVTLPPRSPKKVVKPRPSTIKPKPVQKPAVHRPKRTAVSQKGRQTKTWLWPTNGSLLYTFTQDGSHKQGIGISGKKGQAIYAAGAGKVVYSGKGLVGYGNLIIIKHSEVFLSAYAHNERNLVKEGQSVSQGMKIALLGNSGAHRPMLHFEIRKNGKAVNPLALLPKR